MSQDVAASAAAVAETAIDIRPARVNRTASIDHQLRPRSRSLGSIADLASSAPTTATSLSPQPVAPAASSSPPPPYRITRRGSVVVAGPLVLAAAHKRAHLTSVLVWGGSLLQFLTLGLYVTSIAYDTWEETENDSSGRTVDKIAGKGLLQYMLLSIGCVLGASGAAALTGRIIGRKHALPWLKFFAIAMTAAMVSLGRVATETYGEPNLTANPLARRGAGWQYANNAFKYGCISVGLLVAHEVAVHLVLRRRIHHHLAKGAAARMEELKSQPLDVVHARQAREVQAQVKAEGMQKLHLNMAGPHDPPHSRPTSTDVGGDLHMQHLMRRLLREKDKLTSTQLNLLGALVAFFYIIQIGSIVYTFIEGWELRYSVQFCVVTCATIGYGSSVPRTTLGRALLFFYFPLGFSVMTYTVSLLWTQLFTHAEEHIAHLTQALAQFLGTFWNARRRRAAKRREAERRTKALREKSQDIQMARQVRNAPRQASAITTTHTLRTHGSAEELAELGAVESARLDETERQLAHEEDEELRAMADAAEDLDDLPEPVLSDAAAVDDETRRLDIKLALSLLLVIFILLGGAEVFHWYESWTYFECVYFCFVTLTTIGYGDFSPTKSQTLEFVVYYVLVGLGALAYVLTLINERIAKRMAFATISAAESSAAEAESVRLALEKAAADRLKSLSALPTWNERFLAASFELDRLSDQLAGDLRNKQKPSKSAITEIQLVADTLAHLASTISHRGFDEALAAETASPKLAAAPPSSTGSQAAPRSTDDDDLQWNLRQLVSASSGPPPGKKTTKVVVPRSSTLALQRATASSATPPPVAIQRPPSIGFGIGMFSTPPPQSPPSRATSL